MNYIKIYNQRHIKTISNHVKNHIKSYKNHVKSYENCIKYNENHMKSYNHQHTLKKNLENQQIIKIMSKNINSRGPGPRQSGPWPQAYGIWALGPESGPSWDFRSNVRIFGQTSIVKKNAHSKIYATHSKL